MNVAVISPFWPTPENPTSGIFVAQQVDALRSAGCEVAVISPRPRWLPIPGELGRAWRQAVPVMVEADGFKVHFPRFWHFPKYLRWATSGERLANSLRGKLRQLHDQRHFDVIHAHEIIPVGLGLPRLQTELGLPAVLTLHGVEPLLASDVTRASAATRLARMWESAAIVTLVGRPLRDYAARAGCPAEKMRLLPNGTGAVQPSDVAATRATNQWHGKRVLLSVANLQESKGLDLNLRALAQLVRSGLSDLHYAIVGEGHYRPQLEALVQELGLAGHVRFHGRPDHSKTMELVAACDVFSLPSWQEAFGIVYLEAMARGRPTIGCRTQGAEDIIRDGSDGLLVEPRDVESLARALRLVLEDRALVARLGEKAQETARAFSWERRATELKELYSLVIRSREQPL